MNKLLMIFAFLASSALHANNVEIVAGDFVDHFFAESVKQDGAGYSVIAYSAYVGCWELQYSNAWERIGYSASDKCGDI